MRKFCLALLWLFSAVSFGQDSAQQPLLVDQAFPVKAWASDAQTITVEWDIQPTYYLYKNKFRFTVADGSVQLSQPKWPSAIQKSNEILGNYEVYQGRLRINIPVITAPRSQFELQVGFQGCSEKGYCYPPTIRAIQIQLLKSVTPVMPSLLSFLIMGVLISMTPCVLPMIPVLSAMILGKQHMSHGRAFAVSLAYVLGMAISYAVLGILLAALGKNFQVYLQKPWIIISFSLIFILMALSLFGLYEIKVPEKLKSVMTRLSNHQRRGSLWGAAVMGCLSSLILSPCATPPLIAILSYISISGNLMMGGVGLLVLGLGMGLPLLLVGAFGRRILPKPGPWMRVVETILGIILLVIAIVMLSRILPGSAGVKSPAQSIAVNHPHFIMVKTPADVQKQLENANGKPVLLDFYADWCLACKLIDKRVFNNPRIQQKLADTLLLRADVTANDAEDIRLQRYFQVIAPPAILVFDCRQQELHQNRVIGEVSATEFERWLTRLPGC